MDLFYTNISEFKQQKNKSERQHFAGRYIVEYAAKNIYNIDNTEIEIINNKPYFKYSDIKFSISHSGEIAAVCFDKNPVGLDIERMLPRDFEAISKRMEFESKTNTLEEFYENWTMFEAAYKLQNSFKSKFTSVFNHEYMMSIVSSSVIDIKNEIKFFEIK